MGGLNSGPGPGITLLIAFVLVLCSNVLSAPLYEEDDTQDSNGQGLIEPQGCYYNFQHYNEGERILTNEPCLNCTCRNRMLMCYLRVCPFTKGIGQNCTVEKVPGQCCPIITCPEVPVQLLTSSTTEHSESDGKRPGLHHGIKGTAVGHPDDHGCQIDGVFYPNGAQVPGSPEKPCELCYCIRNKTACIMQSCALHVDGCRPIYEEGQCFPVRYQCDDQPYEEEPTTTIRPAPTPGLIITTTSSEPLECYYNNEIYEDGSRIQTEDPCEHCYCLKGKIACAVQECGAPLEKEGQNCTALPPAPGKCCPDSYQCDITMSSQKFGQGSEGTTEAGFSSVEDAGHPTDGHYPGTHGATKTTEKPKYGSQSGDVTEGLTPDAVTPSKGVSGKPSVSSDGQRPHLDKGQPGSQDSTDLEHQEELDKGTQLPTKHQDSLPNEYEGTPEDFSSVSGQQKITSADGTKPGGTKRPVHGTKPEMESPSSGPSTIPGSLNELVQRQNQSQTDPTGTVHHPGDTDKPHGQKPEQHGDEKITVPGPKPQGPSSSDGTKVQDGIQTTQGSGQPTTEPEHILHVMEEQKPAPGIESHVQDTSSTQRPFDEGLSTLNADSTEKTGSTKPSYGGHWKPQPGIYQPDLQGTPFDVSQGQTSPDRTKPIFPGNDRLPEDNYGYSTPIPAIDEDQNAKGQMTVSNAKDQLIDKLHNIIQDVQAQVNDGKTTEMPEEADYKTTTQSQKGHFTEKPDTLHHPHPGSQDSHHPPGSSYGAPTTTKPATDKETQQGNAVTDTPKDTSDIFNKIQGIIHGMFTQVTEAVQTTLAPLTGGDVDGKKPSEGDEESSSASPEHKPDTTHELKPTDGSSKYPQETKPTDSHEQPNKVVSTGAPDDSDQRPQGSTSYYPQGNSKYPDLTHTRYPDGPKPEDSEYPTITHYPDYISPDGETGDYGKYPEGIRPGDKPYGSTKYPEGSKPGKYPHGTEYPEEAGSTIQPGEHTKPADKVHGMKYPQGHIPTEQGHFPGGVKPTFSQDPSVTNYPDDQTTDSHQNKYPESFKPSVGRPHHEGKYPQGTTPTGSNNYPFGTEYPKGTGSTGRPQDHGKYPEGTKPSGSDKYPHGTEYPDEVGSTVTPDEFGKYPDGTSPVKGSEAVKYPGQTGSTGRPHYSTKYPGSKYPEGFTGKPTSSEDQHYGTEYPDQVGLTGRPQDLGKYPEGSKPTSSQKHPHFPHGTEYPDEYGSTVTPDEFGKFPDETSPDKPSQEVKYPGQTGSTDRPQYSTKYPGIKYPDGFTGKPTGSEDEPHGTEYPEEMGGTGKPLGTGKYPEGVKPTHTDSERPYGTEYPEGETETDRPYDSNEYPQGSKPTSQKRPQYPHGTEYPDEVGSTVTPDEFGKYPDSTSSVKGSEGVKYPSETGSTGRPHYSSKYPGSKYPEGFTGKPIGSEDEPYGTEYPQGIGITGRPQDVNKYPLGTKPTGSHKYPHGTEYPDEIGSTVTPADFGKYPDGTSPVKESEGVKYPSQSGSTSRPQDLSKYPEGTKPSGSDKYPHGSEYPDEVGSTVTPDEFGKYPDETSPVKGPEGVKYPSQTGSTGRPQYSTKYPGSKYPDGLTGKPTGSEGEPHGTEYPEEMGGTGRPHGTGKYPEGVKPTHSDSERPYGTEYLEGESGTDRPYDSSKYPEGSKPVRGPDGVLYPDQTGSTSKPQIEDQYLEGMRPTETEVRPLGTEYPDKESVTERPYGTNEYPAGFRPNEKHPGGSYPSGTELPDYSTAYPNEFDSNVSPDISGKYPHGSKPSVGIYRPDSTEHPDRLDTAGRPHHPGKYPEGFEPAQKPHGSTQHFGRPTGKPFGSEEYSHSTEYPEGFTGEPDDFSVLPDGSRPVRPGYRPQGSKYPTGSPFDSTRFPVGSRPTFKPIESGKYPESSTQISDQDNVYGTQSPYEPGATFRPQATGKYPSSVSKYPDGSKPTYSGKHPAEVGDSKKPQDSQTDYPEGDRPSGSPHVTSKYPEGLTDKPYDHSKYPEGSEPSDKYPLGTEYPEGTGSTVTPDEFGKYPHGTSPVKGVEGVQHIDQTGSTGRPHYPTKYPESKYPEGVTGKPSDSEDEPHGTGKYPEGAKPTHPDSERPYGTEYPEGETGTDRPYDSSKYPDETKPEGVSYPGQTGSTQRPHYSTKLPGNKFPEGVTDGEQELHATKYPEDVGITGKPEYSEKYPEKIRPVGKPDELGKYPGGAKPSDSNKLQEGAEPGKQPEDEESGTGRPYDPSKYPVGHRPNNKYPEGLKPTDSQESTKVPDDGSSPESVTDHQHEGASTDRVSTDRPDLIKYPEGYKPTGDAHDYDKHPDESKPTNEDEFKPETNIPGDSKKHGKPSEEGLKPQQSEKSPDDQDNLNLQGITNKPDHFSKHPEGAQPTSSDKYPQSTKYPDETGSTTKPDEFGKHPEQYGPDGQPINTSKFPEKLNPEDFVKYPDGVELQTEEAGKGTDSPYDPSNYPEKTKPIRRPEDVSSLEKIGSTGRPHYTTKYPGTKYPGKPSDSEDQLHGTEYPDEEGATAKPQDLSKYPEGSKPTSQKRPSYPHGTEYPDEKGSTITPDEFGKYPDGTSPVKGSEGVKYPHGTEHPEDDTGTDGPFDPSKYPEGTKPVRGPDGVKYPGQTGSTGKPHYPIKYPESKYPEGLTGKPTGSENDSYGTEYPGGVGVTGRPQDVSKYPEGTKPTGSHKYPHGTEYPDEVGSTVAPSEFGKYPDGTSPVKGSEGVKHPGQAGSTDRPHYSTKYPGSKYPEGFTGKPTDSEDKPYGTEYPEGAGVTSRPQGEEFGSTSRPQDVSKYPEGTKPTGSEDEPYGTEYPEGVGVTDRPHGTGKYPEGVKPSHSDSERPYGTENPEGETGTERPYDSNKHPEGTKPVRGPDGVKYPGQTGSPGQPLYPDGHEQTYGPEDTNKLSESVKPADVDDNAYTTSQPHGTGVHHRPGAGYRPNDKFPMESQTSSDQESHTTEYPEGFTGTSKPHDLTKYPEGSQPSITGHEPEEGKFPESTKVGEKPKDQTKHPQGTRPEDAEHYPHGTEYPGQGGSTGKPYDGSEHPEKSTPLSHVTKRPVEETGTFGPFDPTKHPDGSRPLHSTKYPGESQPTGQPQDLGAGTSGTKYPEYVGTTLLPHVTSKYPGDKKTSGKPEDSNKLPEDITQPQKRPGAEDDQSSNEYPNEVFGTDKPFDSTEYPEGFKPHYTTKRPAGIIPSDLESMSHSTKHPHEPDGKPDDFEKHPDEKEPVHEQEGVTYPSQTGSSGSPLYPTEYPGSHLLTGKPQNLLPERFTDSPIDSDDRPHGTQLTDEVGVTGRPQDFSKHPEGFKPVPSQKYPHGTEYPNEVGSTVTPDEFGKYPDGTSPVKGSEEVEDPSETGSTGRPQYSTKYPGSKHPEGVTDKPTGSEDEPHGTEYLAGVGSTGRPQDVSKYPEDYKPTTSQKHPHHPQGSKYPDEVGSTVTPDEFGKYPDETSPDKASQGVKYPGQTGSTDRPQYSTKYPGIKYPDGFTGKPTGSEDEPHGTEYPEEMGGTGKPLGTGKYPEGVKPTHTDSERPYGTEYPEGETETDRPYDSNEYPQGSKPTSQKRPQYPHGTEYPDEVGSTVTPDEFGKYPEGTSPVKGSEGVKYPSETGSTGRPQHSTKYPGSKYPEGFTGRPTGSDETHGTEYPAGVDSTGRPHDTGKYPEGSKPSHSESERPYGTEYPEGETGTDRPYDSNEYPEGTKPVRGPDGVKYPDQTGSTGRPHYPDEGTPDKPHDSGSYPEGVKPTDKRPDYNRVTDIPFDISKFPDGSKPLDSEEHEPITKRPEGTLGTTKSHDSSKYPEGVQPSTSGYDVNEGKYPGFTKVTEKPDNTIKYPEGEKPSRPQESGDDTGKPHDKDRHPEGLEPGHPDASKYPSGTKESQPEGATESYDHVTELPEGADVTGTPDGSSEGVKPAGRPHYTGKYPDKVKPTDSEVSSSGTEYPEHEGSSKHPDGFRPSSTPHDFSKYPEGVTPTSSEKVPEGIGGSRITVRPDGVTEYPEGYTGKPHYTDKYPEKVRPTDSDDTPHGTDYPETVGSSKYPAETKPGAKPQDSEKYPESGKPTYSDKYPHGTEYPNEVGSTLTPDEYEKYPDETGPVKGTEGVKYPGQTGSTGRPHYSTKYPGSKYPEGFTGKPTGSEDQSYGTEYPEGVGSTSRPQDHGKYPEGTKPSGSDKYPHGTEYPDEVGSTVTPDEFGKYPDDTSPVKGSEAVKYPGQTGSTGRPHYSTKYPGSKYPEGFTGKPTSSEDQHYGTEYPDQVGLTGRPQDLGKYPEGSKPTSSQKYPHFPHGTEYPDEYGSTVTPDEFGKYPDGTSPVKGSEGVKYPHGTEYPEEETGTDSPYDPSKYPEGIKPVRRPDGVKYPGQFGSTGKPHYSSKYPGSKYPEGFTGKPIGSEDEPYGTEYPQGIGITGRPQDVNKYPLGTKPTGSHKYPHGTEYPDEIGSTVTPDDFGKYPDGTSPVKESEGVKYPSQSGSTSRPQDLSKYPEGTKPSGSDKYPHGSEYPDEVGSTVTPDEFGKYPDETSPVKGPEGVKYPSQTGSTGRPQYSTKYPGSKYPDGLTGKPTGSEDEPHGTEYPEEMGGTGRPHGTGKYPEGVKPTHSDSEHPYGTEYPEGESGTDRPYDSSKYPEGSKPVRGPDGVLYPDQTGSTVRPQGVGEYPEEGKPISEDKYPDGGKPTTPEDSSYGTQYPDMSGGLAPDTSSSTPGTSVHDSVSKQPGSMYLPQFPQTGKPFSPADDKDKPLELPEEIYSGKPGHDDYGSSTPKGSESDGQTVKPGVPVSIDEMDVTTHSPDEFPKRPDSADLTHDPGYKPQSGEHSSKHPSETSSTQSPDSNVHAQYPSTKEPNTDPDGKVAPQGTKAPQGESLATGPSFVSPHTEKASPGVSTPKHVSSETERPVQVLSGHDQSTTDKYEFPIKHPDRERGSTSPGSVNKYSESSDEYSTTEYSPQDGITGKPSGTRPAEHSSRPDQEGVYTTKQPGEGKPIQGVEHPVGVSPGSEGFDGSVFETTTVDNDDLINKLQSIISGIQTQVTNDKTTRQPSTSDLYAPFGQPTEMPHEGVISDRRTTPSSHHRPSPSDVLGEQKPQDHSEQSQTSIEYATDKPYVTGDKRRPIGFDGTRPHGTDKPSAGSVDEYTTGLGEEATEGYLEEENEIHDPEGHLGKKPQDTKKPSFGSSNEFPETDRPTDLKHPDGVSSQHPDSTDTESSSRPSEETLGSHSTKHPEGYTDKPHDTSVQTHDEDKHTSSTDEYPEEGKRPDEVPASGEVTSKPDDSIHFPDEKPGSATSESSTPGISDEHTRKTGSTQVALGDASSTPSYDSEKPEGFDSSTKEPGTHHDKETEDHVHETSSTPKGEVLGVTKTPETSGEPQKGVTKPGDRPGVHPHGEENVPIYHGVESMGGKPTEQPDSMIGGDHTVLPEEDSDGTKKPTKSTEKPSHGVPVDEETAQVTESGETVDSQDHKHPSHHEPTDKPLHVVYPTYYPDGIITRKPGSRPQDTGNKVTVTPQSNVYGTSTPSKEGDDTTQSVDDKEGMKPTGKVPTGGSSVSSGEPVTEGLNIEGSTKGAVPQEGFTTEDVAGKPHGPADKQPDSSVDDTQSSGEPGTSSQVIIIEEVHTEVHSERATTKPGTESYDQTTKSITSVYPHGSDESLTDKPETFDGKTTKKPDLHSHGTESVFQEGNESTVQPLTTDRPQDSLHHTSQPGHGSSVHVSGITESYPDVLTGSTTDETLQQGTGKPAYQTKHPESLDGKSTNEPGFVIDGTTPSSAQSGEPGSQYIMNLYSPKDKYSTTTSPELKGTEQPGAFTIGSRVPGEIDEGSLYTTSKPDESHQGPTFDHEIFGSKFPGRKTTQKPLVTSEAQPDFTTVFGVGTTTAEPQEGVTSTPTKGTNLEHHVPSFIFPQKQPEDGVTSTEGYIIQGKPLSTVGQSGVIFEGKQTTPSYQFVTSGTHDPETSTKKPFQPSVKGASYVPYKIIDGRKVYYPEREVPHKPDEADKHGFDGFDYLPYEIINGKKFFKPNEIISQPKPTSTTPKHRLGMYVPYKIINGTKVYYTEDPQGKPQPGVEDYDGLDYVPFDIINGTKVFYPEAVNEPTSPTFHETTTTPSYIMAMYVPYKIINGTKVYYPEDSPNKPESEDYDGLDYVPFEIVNGKKVFYPERVTTPPKGASTPSHVLAMYVPYKIINGTKVYYPEDPQGKPQTEDYDGLDYVPFEIVNGTKVFYPERVTPTPEATTKPAHVMAMYVPYKIVNGTKVYYPEEPQVGSEEYDGLDYVPFEIVNGTKVFYPERASTTSSYESTTTPSYPSAMYVPYKIVDGRKVYYPKYAQYKPYKVPEGFAGFDYVPYEIVNGSKVFYPDRITTLRPTVPPTKHHQGMYVPYKIVNGTKIYHPKDAEEKPQGVLDGYDGSDYVPYEIVNGTQVFYPEKATTERPGVKAMYVPYKIVDGTKVYYPKDAQPTPNLIPEEYDGFDFVPYEIVNGTQVFYPEKVTTERPGVKAMYVPYKIVDGTKVYYAKDAQPTPNLIPKEYDGFDFVPYEIVNGTKTFYPERVTTPKPNELYYTQGMYVPYKIVDGRKVYYPQRAQHNPVHIPEGYEGFDYLLYDIVNGTKVFHPERETSSSAPTHAPSGTFYPQGMYVPFRVINGTKVFYPKDAQYNPLHIPEGYEGSDYLPYDVVNGTKVFHPERVTSSPAPTHAPSGTFYPQGMYVPFRVINGTKVFYPQDAQHRPDPMKNDYDGWQHLPYDIVNGTKVFYPERVTTEAPVGQMSAMYIPFKMINGTKVFYANDAQYQPYLIPEGYDGFEYVPYEIVNGTKMFYPDRATPTPGHLPTTARPIKQGMFVPYKIINGAKVYYPKHATDSPSPPSSEYNGVDFIPYEVINGTKVFYPDRIQGSELETSGTQAMYVPYKFVNNTKVFYPKDAQFKPYLIPEGYDGFDYLPYEVKNGTKVFYPERVTVTATHRPEQVPSQGMFVPYKMINGQKVYYPKEAQKRPHPLSSEYDGLDYIPYEVVNGTKLFYPEYVTQSADMLGTPMSQAMYVPYKIINGTKVFYPKYAQHKPHLVPDGYDGFEYIPYKIVNGTKFFYPDRVATQPHKAQGMYVPYKIINGTKVFYPKYAQPTLQQLPKGFDGIDYIPYEIVNGTKVFYPEKATPSGVSGTPVAQALYVPYKIINGKKVFYPKYAVERPQTIPEGYDGFAYMPYSIVNGTKMFYPEQAKFPEVSKVPSLQGTFVPYKLLNSTKVFYPKYANDESPRVPDGYDGVDYVPYESVNGTKVFYPELISPQASSGTSPVPGKYVPYKVVNGKKVFYPKEGKPEYPSGGVRYPYDGIVYVPYKSLSGTSPSLPGNYPPFVTPEHSLYGQNSEIVYVDDDDESFRPQFISQSRPSQEQTGGHIGHVPGEGSCFLNNKTYENNMEIQPMNPCQSRCRCINSIVRCVRIKCPPLSQSNTANCSPVYDEGSCCPTYSCENDNLDYLTTTEYPGSQDSSEYPEMVLTGSSSTVISFDSTTQFAVTDASPHKPPYGQDGAGDLSGGKPHPSRRPVTSDGQHPTDQYHIHRPQKPKPSEQGSLEPYDGVEGHPMPGEFSGEDDYDGEDEEPYGPGTCRYAGKVYVSAQQIPRDDPCDFCFCFRSDIICLQQSCPPPIPGCRDEPIQGFCCPRYECHVKMATLLNVTSTTTTTTTTLPPHFFLHPYKGSATRTGCFVQGKAYRVGQAIPSASGPCMDCICRGNGRMECEPKVCTPEPMIRKMIVPAENTTSPSSER